VPPSGTNAFWLKYWDTYESGGKILFNTSGCFDGYTDVLECINKNQLEASCYTGSGGGVGAKWCPHAQTVNDPIICTKNGLFSTACTENYLSGLVVNGDEQFCSEFECDSTKLCYCSYHDMYEQPQAFVNGTWVNMQYIVVPVKVKSNVTFGGVTHHRLRDLPNSGDISLKLKDQKLTITSKAHGLHMIFLDKDNFSTLINTTDPITVIEIPDNYFWTSGHIHVRIYIDYILLEEKYLEVIGRTNCPEYDCIFCKVYFETFSCWHIRHQALFILFVVLFAAAICGLLCFTVPFIWWFTLFILSAGKCMLLSPFNSPLMQDMGHGLKRAGTYAFGSKNNMMEKDAYVEPYPNEGYASNYSGLQGRIPRGAQIYPIIPGMLIALLAISCVSAFDGCTTSQIVTTQTANCVPTTTTTQDCSVTYSADITLTGVGQAVCVTLETPDKKVIATSKISYTGVEDRIFYQNVYWTSEWEGHYDYRVRCNTQGDCNESNCLLQQNSTDRSAHGNIDDPFSTQYPGKTICTDTCTGLGSAAKCNCILLFPACLFSAYGIVPKGETTNVLQMVSRRRSPIITIQTEEEGETFEVVLTTDGGITDLGVVTAKFVGSYNDQVDPVSLDGLTQKGGKYYMTKISQPSLPESQLLGDIQADNPADLLVASTDAFIFSQDLITFDHDDVEASYYFKPSAYANLASASWAQVLPGTVDTQYWIFDNGTVYSRIYTGPSISLAFSTKQPLILSVNTSQVCPDGDLVSVGGCYNCDTGCTMRLDLESDCEDGAIVLTTDDPVIKLNQNSLVISKKKSEYSVSFKTPKSNNNFKLIMTGTKKSSIQVSFIAIDANTTATVNQGFAKVNVTDDHVKTKTSWWNPFSWIEDCILGIASGWEWILVIIMAIGALILGTLAVYFCFLYVVPVMKGLSIPLNSVVDKMKSMRKKNEMKKDREEKKMEKGLEKKHINKTRSESKNSTKDLDEMFGIR